MKDKGPKISVIVPVYKVEDYLHRCIDSILGQTHKNLEIILVDDGSPDQCGKICDQYAKKDSRIKVIHQLNMGLSMARNNGLEIASGEYVGFVDSDDQIAPTMYETLMKIMRNHKVEVAECPHKKGDEIVYQESEDDKIVQTFDEAVQRKNDRSFNNVTNKLYRYDLIKEMKFVKGKIMEDIIFTSEIWSKIDKIGFSPKSLYIYTVDSPSILRSAYSHKKIEGLWVINTAFENFLKLARTESAREVLRQKLLKTLLAHFHSLLDSPELDPAKKNMKKMVRLIRRNSKFRYHNLYFTLINCLPLSVYRVFHKMNSRRIHWQAHLQIQAI